MLNRKLWIRPADGTLRIIPAGNSDPIPTPTQLHQAHGVHAIIRKERARSDRTGRIFSVVVFDYPDAKPSPKDLLRLAKLLLTRVRVTDEVGWFADHQLCVVLPETPYGGAVCFAEDVFKTIAHQSGHRPVCLIQAYPDPDDHSEPRGGSEKSAWRHGGKSNSAPRDSAVPQIKPKPPEPPAPQSYTIASPAQAAGFLLAPDWAFNAPMRRMFVKPIPWWKRTIDVTLAGVGLLAVSPLLAGVALAIRLESSGPAMFKQQRSGLGGKPFTIYKFRTMCVDAEARKLQLMTMNEQDGPAFKMAEDPRITRLGKLLRKTSIDELPQLWNVFIGDMSLVGPRPLPLSETRACQQWHHRRLDVTPGLTCIWQVRGRSAVRFDEWVRMDVEYIRDRGLWNDLKLIIATIPAVLLRRGAR